MSGALIEARLGAVVAHRRFPPFERSDLERYAQASGDLNPLHLQTEFARRAGFEDVIVHGMLGMALLGRLLTESFPERPLRRLSCRFRSAIPYGEAIVCEATFVALQVGAAELALTATIRSGTVAIDGVATLSLEEEPT